MSSPEAEETISLSKEKDLYASSKPKVIALKKIDFNKVNEDTRKDTSPEETQEIIQMKMDSFEQELHTLSLKRETMLEETQQLIDQEKAAWEIQKQTEKEAVLEAGYQEGFTKGEQAAEERYKDLLNEANDIVTSAKEAYHATIEKHQATILQLSTMIAEKIMKQKLKEDKAVLVAIVKEAMMHLTDTSNIAIYLHPSHYRFVSDQREELEEMLEDGDILSIYTDRHMEVGDCLITHPYGQIDASMDTQLAQVKEALSEKLLENQ